MGAMENAGCVTLRDEYLPRSRQDRSFYEFRGLGDPPRDGPHVVRRPGDHEVVGRPLAQRVVRRVGLLPRRGRGDRVHRVLDRLHQLPQADRLPPGPAAEHPPDRGRQRRPARGRGQLRHDHLRQGRGGAQAAGRVGGPRAVPRRAAAVLPRLRLRQQRVRRPARTRWRSRRAASSTAGPPSGCRPPGSTRWRRSSSSTTTAATRPSPYARPPTRTGRRCAGTGSPSASTTTSDGSLVRRDRVEVDVQGELTDDPRARRRAAARPAAAQRRGPHVRQDPARRALARHRGRRASAGSTTRWPAPCAGVPRGT